VLRDFAVRCPIFSNLTRVVLVLAFACSLVAGNHQAQLPQAEIIEKVTCLTNPEQSYALFLPSAYTAEKKWPILYAFDPLGRGLVPVKLFQDAAKEFGFIIVGSNNSRNGIELKDIIQNLWSDTHQRFAIDERRVYTTGFSGGARVASAVALSYPGAVAGVIAASGGPPPNFNPTLANQISFFGTAGSEDFNFPEMQRLKRRMDEVGVTNRLVIFEGSHEWPPSKICGEAISWMEVQAMKSGARAKDNELIDRRLASKTKTAVGYETARRMYEAYLEYQALITEFKGLREVTELAASAERLRSSKEVRSAIKSERAEEEDQANLSDKLHTLIAKLQDESTYMEALAELKYNLSLLTKKSEGSKISEQRVARRVLQSLLVQIYEEAFALKQKKNYASIPAKFELAALIKPKDPRVFYELAAAYARVGNKSRATTALAQAIERGFSDLARIEQNEDFAILRNEADYKKLIAALKKT
jgi:pimeloyl-ACP methyl ester carboxylesterase